MAQTEGPRRKLPTREEGGIVAETIQCENCGAILSPEDLFCGECGAPNPAAKATAAQEPPPPPPTKRPSIIPPAPPDVQPSFSAETGWRAAFIALVVLGVIACFAGLASFLFVGSVGGETTTKQEDWLYSALCCLLPIGGAGAILAGAGIAIWYTRLRNR